MGDGPPVRHPSKEYLRRVFRYNPETGRLERKVVTHHWHKVVTSAVDSRGHLQRVVGGISWGEHRLVYIYHHGVLPDEVDHINGVKVDNRIENLRACSRSQNKANAPKLVTNKSGYKGVSLCKRRGKWKATICYNYKQHWLGYFDDPEEAHKAYIQKAKELFGDFAHA